MDTYCPPAAYAHVFPESSQQSVPSVPSAPHSEPQVQSSKPAVSIVPPSEPVQVQTSIPSSTSTPSEWHRHGVPTTAPISVVDTSAQEQSVLFRFISTQFVAIQTKLDAKFAKLENTVDTKMNQL